MGFSFLLSNYNFYEVSLLTVLSVLVNPILNVLKLSIYSIKWVSKAGGTDFKLSPSSSSSVCKVSWFWELEKK